MKAYLDNSATSSPCRESINAMVDVLENNWGNPSSLHYIGNNANSILDASRKSIADKLSCEPEEIYFTSGGTEGNNWALIGATRQMKRYGKRIVSTSVEHPSVDETLNYLESEGFEVVKLKVDNFGKINENDLYDAVTSDTILISIMKVNNEVGSIMPIECAKRAAMRAKSPALIHCDAVQAFGKLVLKPSSCGIDLMTISSHKIHGPKGVGALFIRKGVKIKPLIFGGEQEQKFRPGTQAMPAIAGFGAAAECIQDINKELSRITELRNYMISKFNEIGGIEINSPDDALPYITNISVTGVKSEPLMNYLSDKGICVSSGSACSKGKKSRVLEQMGLDSERMATPLRISFSRMTTKEEIDYFCSMLQEGQNNIRHIR